MERVLHRRQRLVMPWLSSLRRAWILARARARLARGEPEETLALLADAACAGDPRALDLARRARDAALGPARAGLTPEFEVASSPRPASTIQGLLAEMRARPAARAGHVDARPSPAAASEHGAPAARFRLAVDDAGEYLVLVGTEFVFGHLSSRTADLPFLAGVEREHARLILDVDFHAGTRWRLAPIGSAAARVGGRDLVGQERAIVDGDRVRLGRDLEIVVAAPDPASASLVLTLGHGVECLGASRVLLVAPDAAGRVRIGARPACHVVVPRLEDEVALVASGTLGRIALTTRDDAGASFDVECPPRATCRFTLGARAHGRPPFSILVAPADETGARA